MIAIAISLLFGLAAFFALAVVGLSLRSGLALGVALLALPELETEAAHNRRNKPLHRNRPAIFPVARDHARAGLRRQPPRVAA